MNIVGKEHFTYLYIVLRDIMKHVVALTVPKADKVDADLCPQGEVVQTPGTPASVEALRYLL